jgi:hypothetical protein
MATELNECEKELLGTALVLLSDFMKQGATPEQNNLSTMAVVTLVHKLGVDKEFGKACAQTPKVLL